MQQPHTSFKYRRGQAFKYNIIICLAACLKSIFLHARSQITELINEAHLGQTKEDKLHKLKQVEEILINQVCKLIFLINRNTDHITK